MTDISLVTVPRRPIVRLRPIVGEDRFGRLAAAADDFRARLGERTIWNISSTAVGGGVAELLQALVGYVRDLDIDMRWAVISGDPQFFAITKRVHNRLHGQRGDGGPLGGREAVHYEEILAANVPPLSNRIRPDDLVLLHDPQTAGLAPALVQWGARVVWRCHIGMDGSNALAEEAWQFLRPYLMPAHGQVYSRREYVPSWVPERSVWVIPPSIDPFSAKNQDLTRETVLAALSTLGVLDPAAAAAEGGMPPARFTRRDGGGGQVLHRATVVTERLPGPHEPFTVQVSRWDRLKDMPGVMEGFARYTAPQGPGQLALVGPSVAGVADDPEGAAVYADCLARWHALPPAIRERIMLITLPLDDVDENAAMVNALQRHASVIVQKSLAEGFGLTVAEGMWKGRPVVGSAVGGIRDQVSDGTGVLLDDPTDLAAFGAAVRRLLDEPDLADWMGSAAREEVRDRFVADLHLLRYEQMFSSLMGGGLLVA